jgi:hypothetical protein
MFIDVYLVDRSLGVNSFVAKLGSLFALSPQARLRVYKKYGTETHCTVRR